MLDRFIRFSGRPALRRSYVPSRLQPPRQLRPSYRPKQLTPAAKQELIKRGFEKYIPESFKRQLRQTRPARVEDKEQAYFLRQLKDERTLKTKEEIGRYSRGFLKMAHEQGTKLRSGLNPPGHETEQAKRLLKESLPAAAPAPPPTETTPARPSHEQAMAMVRERLGIQHGRMAATSGVQPAFLEPEPLPGQPTGWSNRPGPAGAGLGQGQPVGSTHRPVAAPLMGGIQTGRVPTKDDRGTETVRPPTSSLPAAESRPSTLPPATPPSAQPVEPPDSSQVHELPI
ncbi:MAG: hypothetical protein HYY50_00180 [Candidatus Kerfeldbacteria bacterium]|nr:hypothetical protein [Candidatus Kerfeldbacteria bacterium]